MKTSVNTFVKALAVAKERKLPMGQIVESCKIGLPSIEEFNELLQTENVPRLWSIRNALMTIRRRDGHQEHVARQMVDKIDLRITEVLEAMLGRSKGNLEFQLQLDGWAPREMKTRIRLAIHATMVEKMKGAGLEKLRYLLSVLPSDWPQWCTEGDWQIRNSLNSAINHQREYDVIKPAKSTSPLWVIIASDDASSLNKTQAFEKIVSLTEGWVDLWEVFMRVSRDGEWSTDYTSLWSKLVDCVAPNDESRLFDLLGMMAGKADSHQRNLIGKLFTKIVQTSKLSKAALIKKLCSNIKAAVHNAQAKQHWDWFPFAESSEQQAFVKLFSEAIQETTYPDDARMLYELANDLQSWNGYMVKLRSEALETFLVLSYPAQEVV